jgi:high-affinity iron transporter
LLPTFVIGLREGLEAALIVGIVAAFLAQEGRRDALRSMWIGVAVAVAVCAAVGVGLHVVGEELPQREQEGLESVIAAVAVGAVTFMIVWMRRHARSLKGDLQASAASALKRGSTAALIGMAFFAVIREGFETAVFLLAAFDASTNATAAGFGAAFGVVLASAIGYGIYRGGVHINLTRFFRATGAVLVLVAAGLVASCLHTAHEAGWFNSLQDQAVDLTWLVKPGTVTASLLTGMLGLQPQPTVGEALGYLLYAVPMMLYVLWPDRLRPKRRAVARAATAAAGVLLLAVIAGCGSESTGKGRSVDVAISDAGCEPASLRVPAGPTTFQVTNKGTSKVTEYEVLQGSRILGEAENIAPGLDGSFSVTLSPGSYTLKCPGGSSSPTGTLTVTGKASAASAAELAAVKDYRAYVAGQAGDLVARTERFAAAVRAGDVERAKALYAPSRIGYERIEPVAEAFGDLDPRIDARVNDVPEGGAWTGFHRIERALWAHDTTAGMAPVARGLVADVRSLQRRVRTLPLEPAQVANGAVELLGEVSKSKITGEEERYSRTDLVDFQANVEGAQAAFRAVRPLLVKADPKVAAVVEARFASVHATLRPYRRGQGYVPYSELTKADTRRLSRAIDALAEPLSRVPSHIVSA